MEKGFIDILKKLVDEQGTGALTDAAKCKAFISDYVGSEYRKESRLVVLAAEAGTVKAILAADNLAACKKAQARVLAEDHFIDAGIAGDFVDALAFVLRGDTAKTAAATKPAAQTAPAKSAPAGPLRKSGRRRSPAPPSPTDVHLAAVKKDGNKLRYVPESEKTLEICLAAVKNNGDALEYVPESVKTHEICLEAVTGKWDALFYVPESMKTQKLYLEAMNRNRYLPGPTVMKNLPKSVKTLEFWSAYVKQYWRTLGQYVLGDVPLTMRGKVWDYKNKRPL